MAKERRNKTEKFLKQEQEKPLPTAEEREKRIERLTGQKDTSKQDGPGRPKKKHGRKTFTTLLNPEYRARLKYIADIEGVEVHDLIDEAVTELLKGREHIK